MQPHITLVTPLLPLLKYAPDFITGIFAGYKFMLTELFIYRYNTIMHQKFDITLKDIIKDMPRIFLKLLTGYDWWEFIDVQFPDVQSRQPDIVIRVRDGRIIHIEVQSTNERIMLGRMFMYAACIYNQYEILPVQIVLYVGKKPLTMQSSVEDGLIKYAYKLVDIRTIDCAQLVVSDDLEDVVLAILCRTDDVDGTIRSILDRFYPLPPKERENYIRKLLYLSELGNLYIKVKMEVMKMPITIDIEDSEVFRDVFMEGELKGELKGRLKGKLEGVLKGVEGMLEIKYGPKGLELMEKVSNIDSIDTLDEFMGLIKKSKSITELRAYLKQR
ncbi:hypothetical protein MBAV_001774 [Candidatus Magnetobacterium bavaricum]|uniref:Transposase (Putative), YhgA-like protein n=1 Tax=Candidatus Magnetobacterium bavaricum TaxID=29290 RepID=A0A0F3GVW4_9BACT|nr:hypothetical protein MBAV_001774 [Candidatus Magnetobacterium bavaricum]